MTETKLQRIMYKERCMVQKWRNMKRRWKQTALIAGVLAAAEAGGSAYLYKRTMKRNNAKVERTMKMAGTDWNQYMPLIQKRKDYMLSQPHEDIYKRSGDGLQLHATYFPHH